MIPQRGEGSLQSLLRFSSDQVVGLPCTNSVSTLASFSTWIPSSSFFFYFLSFFVLFLLFYVSDLLENIVNNVDVHH
jgi:hypothetical protein